MELEEGDLVLCIVDRIIGTNVFVKINPNSKDEIEGTIITSEIAPGRIRNLRDYVVPKKKIVCKVLRISGKGNVELSLRRVSQKEKKEILEQANIEKSYESILKTILKDESEKIIEKIKSMDTIYNFIESAKSDSKILEKLIGKENSKKILEIINSQKEKKVFAKKEITLTTTQPNGLELIKKILSSVETSGIKIKTISAGKYSLKKEDSNLKKADNELKEFAEKIEKFAKENSMNFSVKEK